MRNPDCLMDAGRKCGLSAGQLETLAPLGRRVAGESFFAEHLRMLKDGTLTEAEAASRFSETRLQRQYYLLLILGLYPSMKEVYRERGWPDGMFREISGDVAIWTGHHEENFGYPGLEWRITGWLRGVAMGNVIQFGRLQCNLEHSFDGDFSVFRNNRSGELRNSLEYPGAEWTCVLAPGDPTVNLHIPASGALGIGDCLESLNRMDRFFTERNYRYRAFVCSSWFLDEQLQRILKPESNIVKFQRLGHLFCSGKPSDAVWRVFGEKGLAEGVGAVEPKNDLQRRIANFLNNGGTLYFGGLYILRDELAALNDRCRS
jgi:hypothetical protein